MAENSCFKLKFDKTVSRLAGYLYGKEIYEQQVKNQIDLSKKTYIEFPEEIVRIASSFVQGFFEDIIAQIGVDSIGDKVVIVASPEIKKSIMGNLL